jgi:hypothetical protein
LAALSRSFGEGYCRGALVIGGEYRPGGSQSRLKDLFGGITASNVCLSLVNFASPWLSIIVPYPNWEPSAFAGTTDWNPRRFCHQTGNRAFVRPVLCRPVKAIGLVVNFLSGVA